MHPRPPSTRSSAAGDPAPDDRLAPSGFELRLGDGRAFVTAAGRPLAQGVVARRFRMEVPKIRFPFDLTGGADRFRDQRCLLRELELAVDAAAVARWVPEAVDLRGLCQGPLDVAARPGFLELAGVHPLAGPFTAKLALEIAGATEESQRGDQALAGFLYDLRLYQPSTLSAAELLHRFGGQLRPPALPQAIGSGRQAAVEVLGPALRQLLVPRGFRIPETTGVGLRRVEVLTGQLVLTFEESDLPSEAPAPAELLAREGQRAFAEVEAAIAEGDLSRARDRLRDLSQVEAHPFAAERLLQLLAADPASHDLALDLCGMLRRHPSIPPVALWVEAVLREELGGATEWLRAAQAFLELAEVSLAERGLFSAGLAARRAATLALRGGDAQLATRAYALWESAIPNDVDALMGLAEVAERSGDLPTAMAALRRVAAFAQDGLASASAHARLGKLLLEQAEDLPRARLHLDQALRQNPEDLPSLLALTASCERSGEWVRAVRLKDRAAKLARQRGDRGLAAELFAQAAATWETQLGRPENALLRYRDALAEDPDEKRRRSLLVAVARVSSELGLHAEALAAQREVSRLSPAGRPRAEAFLIEAQLLAKTPDSRAAAEAASLRALEQDPTYREAAESLVRLRRAGPPELLREALGWAAELSEPAARAEFLLERGQLELVDGAAGIAAARLSFAAALEAVPDHRLALVRLASAAEGQGDHAAAAGAVARLAELNTDAEERAGHLRKLAELASWISDPETAAKLLQPAAALPDAPLPVLLRLLEVERLRLHAPKLGGDLGRSAGGGIELQLALRIAEVAEQAGQPELARSVLVEQLDRIERPEEVPEARPLLDRALELDPGSAEVHEVAIRLARLAGDPLALRSALEAALTMAAGQAAPRRLEIFRELAELDLAGGRRPEAIAAYEAMRSLNPDDQRAAQALVDLYGVEGRADQQAEALDQLSSLLWRKGDRAGAAVALIAFAELTWRQDPVRAAESLQRAMTMNPPAEALVSAASLAESLGQSELAVAVLESLSRLLPAPRARAQALQRAAKVASAADGALELGLRAHAEDPSLAWGQLLAALQALEAALGRTAGEATEGEQADGRARALALASAAWGAAETIEADDEGGLSETERGAAEATAAAAARGLADAASEELWLSRLERRDPAELGYARRRLVLLRELASADEKAPRAGGPDRGQAIAAVLERVAKRLPAREAADAFHDLGSLRLQQGGPEAAAAFREAIERDPKHGAALAGLLRSGTADDVQRPAWRRRLLEIVREDGSHELIGPSELGNLLCEEASALSGEGPASRDAARLAWAKAAELLPSEPAPARELARLWLEAGDLRQAAEANLELARRLTDAEAVERGEALIAAVDLLRKIGAKSDAAAAAEQSLARQLPKPAAGALWARLADLREEAGDQAGELLALEQAAALAPLAERTAFQLRRADRFRSRGERDAERIALTLALPGREGDLELLGRLRGASESLADDEAVADAMELMVQALSHRGDHAGAAAAVHELGVFSLEKLQKPRRAEAAFRRTLELAPDHRAARRGLAELLIARGDAENIGRGLDLLVGDLAQEPEHSRAETTIQLAERAAAVLARPDVSLKLLRRLRAQGPVDLRSAALGAELFYAQGATEEALRWLSEAQDQLRPLHSDDSEVVELRKTYRLRRAELLADLGRDSEALGELRDLFAQPPYPSAALDQLRALLDRGVEAPADLPELVFQIASGVRSASRALALIDAELRRQAGRGESAAVIADRLKRYSEQEASPDRRQLFQAALARLGTPEALAALISSEDAPGAAVPVLREALAIERTPQRLRALADLLHQIGETNEASALDGELSALVAAPPEVLERHARDLRGREDAAALARFLEAHASKIPSSLAWLLEAAALRRSAGEPEAEQHDLQAAFAIEPASSQAFAALIGHGDPAAAGLAELLVRRASAVPEEAPALQRVAAELLLQEGRLSAAAELLDGVIGAPDAGAEAGGHSDSGADALLWAVRLEVAAARHEPLDPWLPGLERAILEGTGGASTLAEAVPRAAAVVLGAGLAERAQHLLDLGRTLPDALPEGQAVLELRDRVAHARGDRRGRLAARQALLRRAQGPARVEALEALLEVLSPDDADAPAVLREAWQTQSPPRSVPLAERRMAALEGAQLFEELGELLESLVDAPLAPEPPAEDRIEWTLRAAELRAQQGNPESSLALFERAFADSQGSPSRLRHLLAFQMPAEVRAKVLWELALPASPEERAFLLLERARLVEQKLTPAEAAVAWTDVLREGPGGPGYLLALERTLSRALAEGRDAEAADALTAQAEVTEGGQARALLLEKAAQIRETRLSDINGALELYRRAAAESGDVRWFATLAEAYDRAGRTAEAAAALGVEVARREPGERRREQQRKLGLMLARELNRPSDALPHLRAVAMVDAQEGIDDPAVLEALADVARAAGDAESELMALGRTRRGDRSQPPAQAQAQAQANLLRRAELLRGLDRTAEAAELWSSLLEVDPGNREAFGLLSGQLRDRKAWRELTELLGRHAAALEGPPSKRAELLVQRGSILEEQLAEPAAAERSYREALALAPTEFAALAALRKLVDARGDQGEMAELLAAQIAGSSLAEGAPLALHLGELQLRLGNPEKAAESLRRALAGAERAPMLLARVRLPLAQAELQLGRGLEALAQAEAALTAGAPDSFALLALAGQASLSVGERLRALGHFRELLNRHPEDPAALAGLAVLSRDQSDAIAAEALSQRIAHHSDASGKARALRELATLRETHNDLAGAEAPLRESVRLEPDDDEGFARLRQLLEVEGRFQDLAEALRERARGTADEVVRASSLAEQGDLLRTQLHNPAGAAEAYQRSLEILPRASTSEGYAEALMVLGNDELAAEHYRRALAGGGHLGEFFLLYRLGDIARRLGDKKAALEYYRRAAEANPGFLPAREALVDLAEEVGSNEIALEALRGMAQQLDPREFSEQVVDLELRIADIEKRALHLDSAIASLRRAANLRPADPRPLERLAALYQNGSRWAEAVRVLEQLASRASGPEAAVPLTAAGEISLDKLGDPELAFGLFSRALAVAPGQEAALRRSLEIAAALGKRQQLVELADAVLPGYVSPTGSRLKPTPGWLEQLFIPLAKAYEQAGRLEDAQRVLALARESAPLDLELLQRQSSIAKQSGRLGDEADLEEQVIARLAEERPFEAATRLRALARRLSELTDDQEQARRLLERAAELAPARPEDRRLLADLCRQSSDPALRQRALDTYLELLRRDPVLDLVLLRMVAALAEEGDRPELAQMADSLLQALEGAPPPVAPSLTPLPQAAWSAASLVASEGVDRILQTLAPYFEPLFPVQLSRYGITEADRVGAGHAPELQQWVGRVRESLGSRPLDAYLASGFRGIAVEASRPPALVVGTEPIDALGQAGVQWLISQQLALSELGLTLPAKFSPADMARLAALVTLFVTAEAPVAPAEREQLRAFLGALERACPAPVREGLLGQAPKAIRELKSFDPQRYVAAANAKASRLALLVTGDLRAGLSALRYLADPSGLGSAAWELPAAKALLEWAFSDEYLALRRLALGKLPR